MESKVDNVLLVFAPAAGPTDHDGWLPFNKEGENLGLRGLATEDVVGSALAPLGPGPSCVEHWGPSTTPGNVGLPTSCRGRKGGGCTTLAHKDGASFPTEVFVRERKANLTGCPPDRPQASVCPLRSDAQAAAVRLTKAKKRK
jgi:hypothetical protein